MKVTYLHHSGYVVELNGHILIFDYVEGELPPSVGKKTSIIFASHAHHDHFTKNILKLRTEYPELQFVLSEDIFPLVGDREEVVYMSAGAERKWEGMQVKTVNSTDEGVAFLVKCEGRTIFHAGDLHWWHWNEEGDEWNNRMRREFCEEVDRLKGEQIDLAFLVLDPRQEEAYCWGFDWFMRHVNVKKAFPMHMWGNYETVDRFLNNEMSVPYRERIVPVTEENQEFFIGEGE